MSLHSGQVQRALRGAYEELNPALVLAVGGWGEVSGVRGVRGVWCDNERGVRDVRGVEVGARREKDKG